MTAVELERLEVLAKEMKALLPKYSSVTVRASEDEIFLFVLENDFPAINKIEETGTFDGYTHIEERIGNIRVGGCRA